MIIAGRKILKLYEARRSRLDYRVKRDFIRNGVAVIPCRITSYYDVISTYSVKGFETLNPEFIDYLKTTVEVTPPEYPLVLNIVGDCLTQEEKKIIDFIVRDDLAYDLGLVEKRGKRHTRIFALMTIGLIAAGLLLWLTASMSEVPRELIFILFWFMGDSLCDYIFFTGYDLRRTRRLAGRLASIKVIFSDGCGDLNITKEDAAKLYSEIEKDVQETIEDEK